MKYSEHEKLKAIQEQSQVVGEFLDWLQNEKHPVIAEYQKEDPQLLYPIYISIEQLLADFFDIDLKKIEIENRQILEKQREVNHV